MRRSRIDVSISRCRSSGRIDGEQLVGEVVDDELVVAAEADDEIGRVVESGEREPGQDETGRPALRPVAQLADHLPIEQRGGEQVAMASSGSKRRSAARISVSWPRTRSRPRRNDGSVRVAITRLTWSGQQLDEPLDAGVDVGVVDQVIVVDHDDQRARYLLRAR